MQTENQKLLAATLVQANIFSLSDEALELLPELLYQRQKYELLSYLIDNHPTAADKAYRVLGTNAHRTFQHVCPNGIHPDDIVILLHAYADGIVGITQAFDLEITSFGLASMNPDATESPKARNCLIQHAPTAGGIQLQFRSHPYGPTAYAHFGRPSSHPTRIADEQTFRYLMRAHLVSEAKLLQVRRGLRHRQPSAVDIFWIRNDDPFLGSVEGYNAHRRHVFESMLRRP